MWGKRASSASTSPSAQPPSGPTTIATEDLLAACNGEAEAEECIEAAASGLGEKEGETSWSLANAARNVCPPAPCLLSALSLRHLARMHTSSDATARAHARARIPTQAAKRYEGDGGRIRAEEGMRQRTATTWLHANVDFAAHGLCLFARQQQAHGRLQLRNPHPVTLSPVRAYWYGKLVGRAQRSVDSSVDTGRGRRAR